MKVIILAGGKATRLPNSAKNIPKSLVDVVGKPILQHQIDLLEKHGLTDIRFSLGYMADKIIKYLNGKYEYLIEPKPLGTGGAIKFASRDLKEDFMALNGDVLSDINLSDFIAKYLASRIQEQYNVSRKTLGAIGLFYCNDASDYGVVEIEKEIIKNFLEKPKERHPGYINAGVYILSPTIFHNIKKTSFSIEKDVFPKLSKSTALMAFVHRGWWIDTGTEKRLKEIREKLNLFHVKQ